jgi:hypothetical protein
MAAVEQFLKTDLGKQFERDDSREAMVMTFNPGGWLRRKDPAAKPAAAQPQSERPR